MFLFGIIIRKSTLKQFLDDGHVVLAIRGYYPDITDPLSRRAGHEILVTGYVNVDGKCQ